METEKKDRGQKHLLTPTFKIITLLTYAIEQKIKMKRMRDGSVGKEERCKGDRERNRGRERLDHPQKDATRLNCAIPFAVLRHSSEIFYS